MPASRKDGAVQPKQRPLVWFLQERHGSLMPPCDSNPRKAQVQKTQRKYPDELVARAEYEIAVFERPSVETSARLLAEVKAWRERFPQHTHCPQKGIIPASDLPEIGKVLGQA